MSCSSSEGHRVCLGAPFRLGGVRGFLAIRRLLTRDRPAQLIDWPMLCSSLALHQLGHISAERSAKAQAYHCPVRALEILAGHRPEDLQLRLGDFHLTIVHYYQLKSLLCQEIY